MLLKEMLWNSFEICHLTLMLLIQKVFETAYLSG